MSAHADRNLLIGILALQMDFIDRERLIAAMNAWVLDKTKPLDAILREHGALRDDTRALLAALVDKHLEIHGGDPQRSLGALSSIGSLREDLQSLADPDIAATISAVAADRQPYDPDATASVGVSTSSGTRFRILRPHAQGGLGVISVAHDDELNREVALKEIQSQHAHDSNSRARFVSEAEITGGLEHPGIVPVYGLGQYADGRPFYAMRFIRGDSLKEAVDAFHHAQDLDTGERSLELRKLLGRFVDVCQAVEYAHSRGVLHRDLKPGNIMLGKYGETLVVDWGLAKVVGRHDSAAAEGETTLHPSAVSGSAPTQLGTAIGTPAYMSPEQASGQLDKLGPASDVYSLGATLYQLLVGQSPFCRDDLPTTLRHVQTGEFPRPRELNPQVAKPLEAICLKAMSLRREDRYRSPATLAEDVEKWLADEPVSAWREPLAVRLRRWVRRHQTLVGPTVAAVSVLVLALGAVAGLQSAYTRQLHSKNEELQIANVAANKARRDAENNAEIAREQSQLALKSLESVIFDIQRKLQNVAGVAQLRRSLLRTAIARLKEVSDSFASRAAIDRNTSAALNDLGDVFMRIGSGETADSGANGALTAARSLYQQSSEICEKLAAADPKDAKTQRDLSMSYYQLGEVSLRLGETSEAAGFYRRVLEITLQRVAADPHDARVQRDLLISYIGLGDVSLQSGQISASLGFGQQTLAIAEKLAAADPDDAEAQRDLSAAYARLADLSLQSGKTSEAAGFCERALEMTLQRVAVAESSDAQVLRDLSVSYHKLGNVSLQSGQMSAALKFFQKGLEILEKLAAADPQDAHARRDLSISYDNLGNVNLRSGQVSAAQEFFQKGFEIHEKLAAAEPQDARAQRDLSISYDCLGDVNLQLGQVPAAQEFFQKGLEIHEKLAAADPQDAQAQRDLSVSYERLGNLSLQSGQTSEALTYYQKGAALAQTLAAADPKNAQAQRDLSISYNKLGNVSLQSGQTSEALAYYQKGAAIAQTLAAADPRNAEAQRDLMVSHYKLGEAYQASQEYQKAVAHFHESVAVLQRMIDNGLDVDRSRSDLETVHATADSAEQMPVALGDWNELLMQPVDKLPALLEMRATERVKRGRLAEATQALAKLRETGRASAGQLYNGACVYSMSAAAIKPTETGPLTPEQIAQRQAYIDDALATLKESITAGWDDFTHMQNDTDLSVLHELPEFKALVSEATNATKRGKDP